MRPARWWGLSYVDGANLRPQPSTRSAQLGELPSGRPIVVSGWVAGEEVVKDNPTWAVLSDTAFLYSSVLRPVALPSAPPPPASASAQTGRWIDLNLLHQVVVAYEGSDGRCGWRAPRRAGLAGRRRRARYAIQRRVEKETMDSTSLIGLDAAARRLQGRKRALDAVLQRRRQSAARELLEAARRVRHPVAATAAPGLVAEDAKFFWDWAGIGVPVIAHG